MGLRVRVALLLLLCAGAALTGAEAFATMKRNNGPDLPQEVYARFSARADSAQFYLKDRGGYVAVFSGARDRTPVTVTAIEVALLRDADRAMLARGIPVADADQLLELLEDLGS